MRIRLILTALIVCVSLPAAAEFRTVALAYEIALSDLRVPVTSSGSLIFKECAECESQNIRMTRNTRFIVNGTAVELKEFRKNALHVRDRQATFVTVMHHLESDTITSISVAL